MIGDNLAVIGPARHGTAQFVPPIPVEAMLAGLAGFPHELAHLDGLRVANGG